MNLKIQKQVSLKQWSWWKVGGPAEYFCLPQNLQETKEACQWAKENQKPVTVLSGGTNVLISDLGIKGLVMGLKKLKGIQKTCTEKELAVTALSGTPKHELLRVFSQEKLSPALFLCGLPGDVGGGVVMNAGISSSIFPKEFSQIVDWIKVFSLDSHDLKFFKKEDLKWDYRSCKGWGKGIIYEVGFKWPLKPIEEFSQKLKEMNKKRIRTQPLNQPSCGSVFKNPPEKRAGKLIESSGLKGFSIGGAEVSNKHANFIINKGNATAQDIHQVIEYIQKKVQQNSEILLEPEVHYLGSWNF